MSEPDEIEQQTLPEFEGDPVRAVVTKLSGAQIDGPELGRAMHYGEEGIWLVRGSIASVTHDESKEVFRRVQSAHLSEMLPIQDETDALDLLHKLRAERKAQLDALLGTDPLPGLDDAPSDGDPDAPDPGDEPDDDDPRLDGPPEG